MELNGNANSTGTSGDSSRSLEQIDSARAAAHNTVDKIADAARPAVDRLASGAYRSVDKISGFAGAAAQTFVQRKEQVSVAGAELVEDCRDYVKTNPLVSIGIAAAAGFIISRLLAFRSGR